MMLEPSNPSYSMIICAPESQKIHAKTEKALE